MTDEDRDELRNSTLVGTIFTFTTLLCLNKRQKLKVYNYV